MISFLIAGAWVALVLSLPISATRAGQTLQSWAGVLFLLALSTPLLMGLVGAMGGAVPAPQAAGGGIGDLLGTVLGS